MVAECVVGWQIGATLDADNDVAAHSCGRADTDVMVTSLDLGSKFS